jgi:hypothetical protein
MGICVRRTRDGSEKMMGGSPKVKKYQLQVKKIKIKVTYTTSQE